MRKAEEDKIRRLQELEDRASARPAAGGVEAAPAAQAAPRHPPGPQSPPPIPATLLVVPLTAEVLNLQDDKGPLVDKLISTRIKKEPLNWLTGSSPSNQTTKPTTPASWMTLPPLSTSWAIAVATNGFDTEAK